MRLGSQTNQSWKWPVAGVLVAIAITSAMDATGTSAFSSLPLFPLITPIWLGISNTAIYGPEVGFLGLLLNVGFADALYCWCARERLQRRW